MSHIMVQKGIFKMGMYGGRTIEDVAQNNPSYLMWALGEVDSIDAVQGKRILIALKDASPQYYKHTTKLIRSRATKYNTLLKEVRRKS